MDLILPLKRRWFEDIKAGRKPFEYRLNNAYWQKRLIGKNYDRVIFTLGYPKRDDDSRRIVKPYSGYEMQTVVSEEWNNEPQDCFAIIVTPDAPSKTQMDQQMTQPTEHEKTLATLKAKSRAALAENFKTLNLIGNIKMRRTGQTFRALLGSLTMASEGKDVIYECIDKHMAMWTFDKAVEIVSGFMEPEIPEPRLLKIGTGTVRFTGPLHENQQRNIDRDIHIFRKKYEFVFDK